MSETYANLFLAELCEFRNREYADGREYSPLREENVAGVRVEPSPLGGMKVLLQMRDGSYSTLSRSETDLLFSRLFASLLGVAIAPSVR